MDVVSEPEREAAFGVGSAAVVEPAVAYEAVEQLE